MSLAMLAVLTLSCEANDDTGETSDPPAKKPRKKGKKSGKKSSDKSSAPDGKETAAPSGSVTITLDPKTGKAKVKGAPKRTGDPKDCAAFDACCTSPNASLFCRLAEASTGDCGRLLKDVKGFLAEKKATLPAGCK